MSNIYVKSSSGSETVTLLSFLRDEGFSIQDSKNPILIKYDIPEHLTLDKLSHITIDCVFELDPDCKFVSLWDSDTNYDTNIEWDEKVSTLANECDIEYEEYFSCVRDFIEGHASRLEEVDPNWRYLIDDNSDAVVVKANDNVVMSELTISNHWPDSLCRRVKIAGKYYYFS